MLDLGTGTGIIATLLCAKTKLSKIYGIDIQKDVCDMASRSIRLNNLENK
jgi:tRNA1Val (adenine37-N6)-methyltransferase